MATDLALSLLTDPGVFGVDRHDDIVAHYRRYGFVVLRDIFDEDLMARMEAECVTAQRQVVAGELAAKHGSTVFLDDASKAGTFANYVEYVNELSPAVRGSHRWATPAPYRNINNAPVPADARPTGGWTDEEPPFEMPLGFEKIRGEIPVYTERGDVILHDAYLWHSAARATDDVATRRHVRGGYLSGDRDGDGRRVEFVKNAAR